LPYACKVAGLYEPTDAEGAGRRLCCALFAHPDGDEQGSAHRSLSTASQMRRLKRARPVGIVHVHVAWKVAGLDEDHPLGDIGGAVADALQVVSGVQ